MYIHTFFFNSKFNFIYFIKLMQIHIQYIKIEQWHYGNNDGDNLIKTDGNDLND